MQLTVLDSGTGLRPDQLDDVFRDYVRLNPTKASEGLGIGLSIVRRAAELLHGLILASPQLPALLVTGDLDAAIATQAEQAGMHVAHKPLAPRKLAAFVKGMLHAPAAVAGTRDALAT